MFQPNDLIFDPVSTPHRVAGRWHQEDSSATEYLVLKLLSWLSPKRVRLAFILFRFQYSIEIPLAVNPDGRHVLVTDTNDIYTLPEPKDSDDSDDSE